MPAPHQTLKRLLHLSLESSKEPVREKLLWFFPPADHFLENAAGFGLEVGNAVLLLPLWASIVSLPLLSAQHTRGYSQWRSLSL